MGTYIEDYYSGTTEEFRERQKNREFDKKLFGHLSQVGFSREREWCTDKNAVNGYGMAKENAVILHRDVMVVNSDGNMVPKKQTVIVSPLKKHEEMENAPIEEYMRLAPQEASKADADGTLRLYRFTAISQSIIPKIANSICIGRTWSEMQYTDVNAEFMDVIEELKKDFVVTNVHGEPGYWMLNFFMLIGLPSIVIGLMIGFARGLLAGALIFAYIVVGQAVRNLKGAE